MNFLGGSALAPEGTSITEERVISCPYRNFLLGIPLCFARGNRCSLPLVLGFHKIVKPIRQWRKGGIFREMVDFPFIAPPTGWMD